MHLLQDDDLSLKIGGRRSVDAPVKGLLVADGNDECQSHGVDVDVEPLIAGQKIQLLKPGPLACARIAAGKLLEDAADPHEAEEDGEKKGGTGPRRGGRATEVERKERGGRATEVERKEGFCCPQRRKDSNRETLRPPNINPKLERIPLSTGWAGTGSGHGLSRSKDLGHWVKNRSDYFSYYIFKYHPK